MNDDRSTGPALLALAGMLGLLAPARSLTRVLPDGRTLEVTPLTFGRARLHVTSRPEDVGRFYDDFW